MPVVDVLTNRYNPARTGANLNETILNQSNVNVNGFGEIFTRTVDGQIYAQPLIVTDLAFPNIGSRSAVFVATTRNMVYAFDAEERSRLRLGLFVWCGLPVAGQGGGADHADLQYRRDEPSPLRDQQPSRR